MKAWPSGLAVNGAWSNRGIGKVLRRLVKKAQAIRSRSLRETPTRGCSPGQIRARASTSSGCRLATMAVSFPLQLIPVRAVGSPGCPEKQKPRFDTGATP